MPQWEVIAPNRMVNLDHVNYVERVSEHDCIVQIGNVILRGDEACQVLLKLYDAQTPILKKPPMPGAARKT